MFTTPELIGGGVNDERLHRARRSIGVTLALAMGSMPLITSALPVIPGGVGYGIDTPAGRGGQVYRVTNLNESGAGSLKECVAASGPRVCVFEVSGTIRLHDDLHIWNPNITIAGQTAPSPGIMLRGAALNINASDVLVQHIRIRAGDDMDGPDPANRDALKIESSTGIRNIVIDHCSVSWGLDETLTLWDQWDNVTLTNNIISEGLRESIKSNGYAGYGLLVGPTDGRVSIQGNLLAHILERNPLSRGKQMVFVNNVVYNRGTMDVDLQSEDGRVTSSSIVGNVFIRGADYTRSYNKPVLLRTDSTLGLPSSSKVYVADNYAIEGSGTDQWSVVSTNTSEVLTGFKASSPPAWPAGLTALPTQNDTVLNKVLKFSGARPADRDPVDRRVVQSVRDRNGNIINCVAANGTGRCNKNAGGWPALAQNRRALTLPSDPAEITASGYTNLELWLHRKSAEVEGRTLSPPLPPILAVQ